jgi:mannose-6-phosphate isomerase-like protein (cupin superfamily)
MNKKIMVVPVLLIACSGMVWQAMAKRAVSSEKAVSHPDDHQGFVLEHDADVSKRGTGPHDGGGESTSYNFFDQAAGYKQVFRKRVLHPGSAIGYHLQKEDEVYYVLSGTGTMQMNGKEFPVKAGDGILTRPGSSHGLKQTGRNDLVLIITYEKK